MLTYSNLPSSPVSDSSTSTDNPKCSSIFYSYIGIISETSAFGKLNNIRITNLISEFDEDKFDNKFYLKVKN